MKISLDDLQDYLTQYHKYSGYSMACCEFHDDNSPSMQLTERGYYCKSCGAKGSLEKLYAHVTGRPIHHTEKVYNPSAFIWDRWIDEYGSVESTCKQAHGQLVQRPELAIGLYRRGLTQCQVEIGTLGFLSGYYIFPIKDQNKQIVGAVARASKTIQTKNNRYSASKHCPLKLYVPSWEAVNSSDELYVCYGTLDAWSLLMAGYPSVTGISGQEFNASQLDQFRKPIYIIADKHEEKSAIQLQSRLGWRGKRLDLDWDDLKDPNDIHVKFGLEVLREKIERAKEKYRYD